MARNGSGTMSVPYDDFVAGTAINSTQMDANFADIVAEITNSIPRDGQAAPTANIPMGNFKLTGLGAGSSSTDSVNFGQVQAQAFIWCGTAGGTKNAITLSPSPAITAYAAGQVFRFKAGSTQSDSTVTVAVSGLTAKDVQNEGAALSASNYVEANKIYEIIYDGANFQISKISTAIISSFARSVIDDADADTARATLGCFGVIRRQVFTSSGTYTPHANMTYCDVEALGAGGGGGGSVGAGTGTAAAGGGGAGGYCRKVFPRATIGVSQTVTIGAAGAAGASGNNNGGTGGNTTFGALLTANGGTGGGGGGNSTGWNFGARGAGGSSSSGDVNASGSDGFIGQSPGTTLAFGGQGASSQYGRGGTGGISSSGGAGTGYGSGGGGGAATSGSVTGAAGTAGLIIITEYCTA